MPEHESNRGRTIRLFMVDGTPSGILIAELMGWTGQATVGGRFQLSELALREDAKRIGVYFLVGPDPENMSNDLVYIGESENVFDRLKVHDNDSNKGFWNRFVFFTSKDENLTKAPVRYLESRLIEQVTTAGRARLDNGTTPETPKLPESEISDMEFFLDYIKMMMPILGFSFLRARPSEPEGRVTEGVLDQDSILVSLNRVGASAKGFIIGEEFWIRKDSTTRRKGTPSWKNLQRLRNQLVSEWKLIESEDTEYYVFTEDVLFPSPSAASNVVMASKTNGRVEWKIEKTGETINDYMLGKIREAEELGENNTNQ